MHPSARRAWAVVLFVVTVSGCGSSTTRTEGTSTQGAAMASGMEMRHGHHGHVPGGHRFPAGPVSQFHDVLHPLWHSEPGPDRVARTCAQTDALRQHASSIATGPVPEEARGREEAWRSATAVLSRETEALGAECATSERRAVEERLAAVHTAFRQLIENLGERHCDHHGAHHGEHHGEHHCDHHGEHH